MAAFISLIAGIGLVGVTFSIATVDGTKGPQTPDGEADSAALAPEAGDGGPVLDLTPDVRRISTGAGSMTPAPEAADDTAAAVQEIPPPAPRTKPERSASVEPDAAEPGPRAIARSEPGTADRSQPAAESSGDETDALIANIEKTLSEKEFEPAPEPLVGGPARIEDGVAIDGPLDPLDLGNGADGTPPVIAEYPPAGVEPLEALPPQPVIVEPPPQRRPKLLERWFGWLRPNPPPPPPINEGALVGVEPLPPGARLPPADIPSQLPVN
jgi:hypothetical protein